MASLRSLRGLDSLNFFLADVRDGIGPFLGVYLLSQKWSPSEISLAMSVGGIATIIAQTPAGYLSDRLHCKRLLLIAASVLVGLSCVAMTISEKTSVVLGAQIMIGICAAFIAPLVSAISLGLVGKAGLDRRIGRNESINHTGNVVSALIAGLAGYFIGGKFIFYLVALMSVGAVFSILRVREEEINHEVARGCEDDTPSKPLKLNRQLIFFSLSVILFHFANAYMLPLLGQDLAKEYPKESNLFMSACILIAQGVMIPVTLLVGKKSHLGRKKLLLIGFLSLPIRALFLSFSHHPAIMLATQALDGIGAGIFGVVSILMIADLTRGTGRFNFLQGCIGTALAIGASAGAILIGQVTERFSYQAGYGVMGAIAVVACLCFYFFVDETLDHRERKLP